MSTMNENVIYQPMTEKLEMPSDEKIRSVPVRDYREHAGIRKTRIILLVLLSIQLVRISAFDHILVYHHSPFHHLGFCFLSIFRLYCESYSFWSIT